MAPSLVCAWAGFLLSVLATGCTGSDYTRATSLNHAVNIDELVEGLSAKMDQLTARNDALATRNKQLEAQIEMLLHRHEEMAEYNRALAEHLEILDRHTDEEIGDLKENVKHLSDRGKAGGFQQNPIAFTATTSIDFYPSGPTAVPYDMVLLNHGEGYNSETYTFTPPVRGLYFFIVSMGPVEVGQVNLLVNGETKVTACDYARSIHWESGDATSAILFLEVTDQVWVSTYSSLLYGYSQGGARNSFAGFLYAEL